MLEEKDKRFDAYMQVIADQRDKIEFLRDYIIKLTIEIDEKSTLIDALTINQRRDQQR